MDSASEDQAKLVELLSRIEDYDLAGIKSVDSDQSPGEFTTATIKVAFRPKKDDGED